MRKSQITIFIIIGVTVLLGLGFIIMLMRSGPDLAPMDPEMTQITGFVSTCLEEVAGPGVKLMGSQGGHIFLPKEYVKTPQLDIAYGYYRGNNTLASKGAMEHEISNFIDDQLLSCIANFSSFPGKSIEFEKPKTRTSIGLDRITINTDFPLTLDGRRENDFSTVVPISLGRVHDVAADVIENIRTDPGWIDLSYLSRYEGVKVNLVPHETDTMLYFLMDDRDYLFVFASKFNLNKEPVLDMPDVFEIKDGEFWEYQINCIDPEGEAVVVTDDTAMIDTADGVVSATPEIPGEYDVTFSCSDGYNDVEKTVRIKVLE